MSTNYSDDVVCVRIDESVRVDVIVYTGKQASQVALQNHSPNVTCS